MLLVFMHIVAWPVSDIFSTCVFNNIMGLTFIFSPRVFLPPPIRNHITRLVSITWRLARFLSEIANPLLFLAYSGVERAFSRPVGVAVSHRRRSISMGSGVTLPTDRGSFDCGGRRPQPRQTLSDVFNSALLFPCEWLHSTLVALELEEQVGNAPDF